MEISSVASSSSKLLEALEKLGTSQGTDLRSTGPLGVPSQDVIRLFEDAMNNGQQNPQTVFSEQKDLSHNVEQSPDTLSDGTVRIDSTHSSAQADFLSQPVDSANKSSQVNHSAKNNIQELQELIECLTQGNINPSELYRLQYLIGMLKVHATSGEQTSQQISQSFESILKQQS